jgi:hypothetical protein
MNDVPELPYYFEFKIHLTLKMEGVPQILSSTVYFYGQCW